MKVTRRLFVSLVALVLTGVVPVGPAMADGVCTTGGLPGQCTVGIPSHRMQQVMAQQEASQWCWAASISMVFDFYGHPLGQEEIVRQTYGAVVNLPAGDGRTMTRALNREYVDANGRRFRVRAAVFDPMGGQVEITNNDIARELKAGRPLIVGTQGHAMVVSGMDYLGNDAFVGQVVGVTVRDPWPTSGGLRRLSWSEMHPTYVAKITVESVTEDEPTEREWSDSDEGGLRDYENFADDANAWDDNPKSDGESDYSPNSEDTDESDYSWNGSTSDNYEYPVPVPVPAPRCYSVVGYETVMVTQLQCGGYGCGYVTAPMVRPVTRMECR